MEEKNATKISLSTFFLILSIIAIIIMGIFIYKLNNDKTTEIQKSTELQAQVNSLNGTVSDLQGKIDNISKTINSNNLTNTENKTNTSNNSIIKDNTANNTEQVVKPNIGTFSVKDITDDESNDGVIGWMHILENNKFEIPRTKRNV